MREDSQYDYLSQSPGVCCEVETAAGSEVVVYDDQTLDFGVEVEVDPEFNDGLLGDDIVQTGSY